jgi:hypothetical protein
MTHGDIARRLALSCLFATLVLLAFLGRLFLHFPLFLDVFLQLMFLGLLPILVVMASARASQKIICINRGNFFLQNCPARAFRMDAFFALL